MAHSHSAKSKTEFGLHIYMDMLRKRALRLPINYFFNAHLFDLVNGVDTHTELQKDEFGERPPNFENGHIYMPSWTNEIKQAFFILRDIGALEKEYTFIDVGCGKGKVCLYWRFLSEKFSRRAKEIIGIDYCQQLIEISRENSQIMFQDEGEFYYVDVTEFDFKKYNSTIIIYLFNPFDDTILEKMLSRLPENDIFIVYNNPIYNNTVENHGFHIMHKRAGWHPCLDTNILTNRPLRKTA